MQLLDATVLKPELMSIRNDEALGGVPTDTWIVLSQLMALSGAMGIE